MILKNRNHVLLLIFWAFLVFPSVGQNPIQLVPMAFDEKDELPAGLLSTKTLVILDISYPGWKKRAETIHTQLADMGIDAIAYFHEADLNAGIEIRSLYAQSLARRGVKNVALFSVKPGKVSLFLTAFDGTPSFYQPGQEAWRVNAVDLDQALTGLYRKIGQSRLKLRNHLISQVPEYFHDLPLIRGNRMEQFARDLKLDKLAILQMPKLSAEGASEQVSKEISAYNESLKQDSLAIAEIMKEYPFQYDILPYQEDLEALRTLGYQFVLYQLHDSGKSIKAYLNYSINPSETDYLSVNLTGEKPTLKKIGVDEKVYKYYVKHIYSRDVYLGKDWDSDKDWRPALRNFIYGLKRATKVK